MVWDRTIDGECRITYSKGIKQLLELIKVSATRATPGDDDLLRVDESSKQQSEEEQRKLFASTVMEGLYIAKQLRGDILVATLFLARRMTKATEEDWKKLVHLIEYIFGTKDYGLLLKPGSELALTVYCDAAYGTGALMSIRPPDVRSTLGTADAKNTMADTRCS